jgi:hypothetical protein
MDVIASGSARDTRPVPVTEMALSFFEPITPPKPPWLATEELDVWIVAIALRRSPAGPDDQRAHPLTLGRLEAGQGVHRLQAPQIVREQDAHLIVADAHLHWRLAGPVTTMLSYPARLSSPPKRPPMLERVNQG